MKQATTVRLEKEVQEALETMSNLMGRTKNGIINDAVARYVQAEAEQVAQRATQMADSLKAYRSRDPKFEKAMQSWIEDEVKHSEDDPYEGEISTESSLELIKVRQLIHG